MTPERWQRVNELFEWAAATPVERRDAELDEACAGDASLRAEVESLLVSDARAAGFLRDATNPPSLEWAGAASEDMTGRMIGAYRVAKRLAFLLDNLAKMNTWLRFEGRGQLQACDRQPLTSGFVKL